MDFVDFELAKKLKEEGFKEQCLAYYTNTNDLYFNYSHKAGAKYSDCYLSHNLMPKDSVSGKFFDAPTISQVLKWLREEKKIFILIDVRKDLSWFYEIWGIEISLHPLGCVPFQKSQSYEQAAIAGIEYVLDNLI